MTCALTNTATQFGRVSCTLGFWRCRLFSWHNLHSSESTLFRFFFSGDRGMTEGDAPFRKFGGYGSPTLSWSDLDPHRSLERRKRPRVWVEMEESRFVCQVKRSFWLTFPKSLVSEHCKNTLYSEPWKRRHSAENLSLATTWETSADWRGCCRFCVNTLTTNSHHVTQNITFSMSQKVFSTFQKWNHIS